MSSKKRIIVITGILLLALILSVGVYYFFYSSEKNINSTNTNSGQQMNGLSWLSTNGQNIINENGEAVFLKGVNFGNWLLWEGCSYGILNCAGWPEKKLRSEMEQRMPKAKVDQFFNDIIENYILPEDFENVKDIGLNFVRLGFHYRYVKQNELTKLDEAVQWAKEAGVYVILNMHAAPGAQAPAYFADSEGETLLWQNENYQQEYYRLWEILAERYKNELTVAGYEILNEPDTDNAGMVTELYRNVITKIRAIDDQHIIFLDGNHYASDFSIFPEPLDSNSVYVFHDYTKTLEGLKNDNDYWGYSAFSQKYNVPLTCNEFGMWQLHEFSGYFEQNNIHYAPWSYKGWDNPAPYVSFENSAWRQWIEELNVKYPTSLDRNTISDLTEIVNNSNLSSDVKTETLSIINSSGELRNIKEAFIALPKRYPADADAFAEIRTQFNQLTEGAESAWLDGFTKSIQEMTGSQYSSIMESLRTK